MQRTGQNTSAELQQHPSVTGRYLNPIHGASGASDFIGSMCCEHLFGSNPSSGEVGCQPQYTTLMWHIGAPSAQQLYSAITETVYLKYRLNKMQGFFDFFFFFVSSKVFILLLSSLTHTSILICWRSVVLVQFPARWLHSVHIWVEAVWLQALIGLLLRKNFYSMYTYRTLAHFLRKC